MEEAAVPKRSTRGHTRLPDVAVEPSQQTGSLEFALLGSLEVTAAGRTVALVGSRVKSLLAILLVNANHVVSTDRLADELWAGRPPGAATATLQAYVSELRKALAEATGRPAPIATVRPGYVIELESDQLDISRFERLIAGARAATRDQPDLIVRLLREATGMWRGPPLTDFATEPFAQPIAARLEEARLWALEERIEIELGNGLHHQLITELHDLAAEYPLRERLWGQWILALYRCGRQADALRVYQDMRRRLNDDLALEPTPALQRLEHAILEQDTALELPPDPDVDPAGRGPAGPQRRHNLPTQLTNFIGRGAELEQARRLLASTRLLTLTATGGAGKTRLAVELAREQVENFGGGVWFVDLSSVTEPASVAGAVVRGLGLQKQSGSDLDALVDRLGDDRTLVVLDNCEHLVDACAELVEEIVTRCAGVVFVATSREELRVPGETVWRVPSLSLPSDDDASGGNELLASEAVQLFLARASTGLAGFDPDDDALMSVAHTCRRLDGIPLAIELAAALVAILPVGEIADRLDDRFGLLTRGTRRAVPRQRTLRAAIDWSYDLLDPAERQLFGRLSVFVGEFTLEAAEAVAVMEGSFLPTMSALISKSMVAAVPGSGGAERYRLLDSLRHYGLERLAASGVDAAARRQHAAYYASFAEAADRRLHGRDATDWSMRVVRELPNIRSAMDWAFSGGDLHLGVRLCGALRWWFFGRMGQLAEARKWLDQALERRDELPPSLQLKALTAAMNVAFALGDYNLTSSVGEEAVALAEELGDRQELIAALMARGGAAVYEGDLARAVECLQRGIGYCRAAGDRWGAACMLTFWGVASRRTGQHELAEAQLTEALATFRDLRDTYNQVFPLIQLALLAQGAGELERAKQFSDEAIELTRGAGDRQLTHTATSIAGRVELARGDLSEARRLLVSCLRSYRGAEHPLMVAIAVEGLAMMAQDGGRSRDGVELWGFADGIRDACGMPLSPARQIERGRYLDRARECLGDEAVDRALAVGRLLSHEDVVSRAG